MMTKEVIKKSTAIIIENDIKQALDDQAKAIFDDIEKLEDVNGFLIIDIEDIDYQKLKRKWLE